MAQLQKITLRNFRNFKEASFSLDADPIVLTGQNGTGKTSILEALFFISKLRSFRTARAAEMRKIGENFFQLSLEFKNDHGWNETLVVSDGEQRRLMVDGISVSRASEFAGHFEAVIFLPDDPLIVTGAPSHRRKFIDMLISAMDRSYFILLQQYRQALENYNRLLQIKPVRRDTIFPFAEIMASTGSKIICRRLELFKKLQSKTARILNGMRPELADFTIISHHDPDLENEGSYRKKLDRNFDKDSFHGKTCTGPHYCDFEMIASENQLRCFGSRGQCRIAALALKLAEVEFLNSDPSKKTVILVDDALADLDEKLRETFLDSIKNSGQKIFAFPELPSESFFSKASEIHL